MFCFKRNVVWLFNLCYYRIKGSVDVIKVKVVNIEGNIYNLECNNEIYKVHILLVSSKKIKIGDILYIPNKILMEKNLYTYGDINSKYGKNIDLESEYLKVIKEDEEYYLQRYYG